MNQVTSISKPNRPLTVSIPIAIDIVIAVALLTGSFKGFGWGWPAPQVASWAVLGLGISTSSFLAWMGSRYARNALLVLLTFYLGLLFAQSVQTYDDSYTAQSALWAAFSVVLLVTNWWLLLNRRARMFFA